MVDLKGRGPGDPGSPPSPGFSVLRKRKHVLRVSIELLRNTHKSLGELEKAVETLTCGSCSHSIFCSPKFNSHVSYNSIETWYMFSISQLFFKFRCHLCKVSITRQAKRPPIYQLIWSWKIKELKISPKQISEAEVSSMNPSLHFTVCYLSNSTSW